MRIRYTFAKTAVGLSLVGATDNGVCCVLLGDEEKQLEAQLAREFPEAEHVMRDDEGLAEVAARVAAAVDDPSAASETTLDVAGTEFQMRVWNELRRIAPGQTATYTEIAERIGSPSAVRAVAGACAANHVAILVPCHRVVRSDGSLGGFKWGLGRKQALLRAERIRTG
jgi:AraC family transcriptional regulator, regulatory protein of adaptative response / methylated-DNA-[protein]-cysteine methyltransferase